MKCKRVVFQVFVISNFRYFDSLASSGHGKKSYKTLLDLEVSLV